VGARSSRSSRSSKESGRDSTRRRGRRPGVSVVIPVKDDARHLKRCLTALAAQTRPPREVIVVDNNSSDDSRRVAKRFGARVLRERRPGIPATASRGYDAARFPVIARLDADSIPPADWVERIEKAFRDDPRLAAVTGPGDFPALTGARRRLVDVGYMAAYFVLLGALLRQTPLFGSNLAMRRSDWRSVRGRVHRTDKLVHDDLDLSIQLAGRPVRLDRSLRVPVSSRPFRSKRALVRRVGMGIWTVVRNVPALLRRKYTRGDPDDP